MRKLFAAMAAAALLLVPGARHAPLAAVSGKRIDPPEASLADMAAEFPTADNQLWLLEQRGLRAARARRMLAAAPEDPVTLALLVEQGRIDDAVGVLRSIVSLRPERLPASLAALHRVGTHRPVNPARGGAAALLAALGTIPARLSAMPREDGARATLDLIATEQAWKHGDKLAWQHQLTRFAADYSGTQAALLAQVDLIVMEPVTQQQLDRLDALAHPGTEVGAKALYRRGTQLAVNVPLAGLEPRGADPSQRFLQVAEIARELESGSYPPSEWVSRAPSLLSGFVAAQPVYADGSLDRMLEAALAFVKTHFITPGGQPAIDAVEAIVVRRMGDLYTRKGESIVGVERVLASLEQGVAGHDAAKFMRASFYLTAREGKPPDERAALTRKALETLTSLHDEADGLYERKALAAVASLQFTEGDPKGARDSYKAYLSAYPESSWTWVAGLRIGQCDEALGDWTAADDAYRQAATRFASIPVASVLGQELGARASEALGNFDEALEEHWRALKEWDSDYGPNVELSSAAAGPGMRSQEVSPRELSDRIAQLTRTLGEPGGPELERGRWLLARQDRERARVAFEHVIATFPDSPIVPEARYLAGSLRPAPDIGAAGCSRRIRSSPGSSFSMRRGRRLPHRFARQGLDFRARCDTGVTLPHALATARP